MSTISKERVAGIASGEKCYTHDDVVELARIALASLEAEAVAFVMADDLKDSSIISTPAYRDLGEAMERTVGDVVALYAAPPAQVSVPDDESESEMKWRDLALQFDGHRMQSLCFLKYILSQLPETEFVEAREFLKSGPLPGEEVLRNRIAAMLNGGKS